MAFLETPPPEYRGNSEQPASDDIRRAVDRIEMQVHGLRLPAERYGSVARKPLPYS